MGNNDTTMRFELKDNGSLKQVTTDATKASKALDWTAAALSRLTKNGKSFSKTEKGVAGATSNSTKAFSKQAQSVGGILVPAYAALAANIFAVTAAFGALQRAAALTQLEAGLVRVGNAGGKNLNAVANSLREITGAAISTKEAMASVALGTSAGFSTEQLKGLTKVAKGASLALGRDMEDAMNRLIRGAAKLEPEILDELGIMVRLDDATEAYATTLGKTASQLTQFERRMAFTNAIIDQGASKYGAITKAINPNPYDKLAASFSDLTKDFLILINSFASPVVGFLADNTMALTAAVLVLGATIAKQMVPSLLQASDHAKTYAKEMSIAATATKKLANEKVANTLGNLTNLPNMKGMSASYLKMADAFKEGRGSAVMLNTELGKLKLKYFEHSNQLDALITKHGEGNAQVKRKIKLLATEKLAIEQTKAAISKLAVANATETASRILSLRSAKASLASKALESAANLQFSASIRSVILSTRAYQREQLLTAAGSGVLSKAITIAKTSFYGLSLSIKTVGTTLLTLMPYIGLAAMALSMLSEAYDALFGKSEYEQALDGIIEGFNSLDGIGRQLDSTIINLSDSTDIFIARLRVSSGVLDQLKTSMSSLKDAQAKTQQDEIAKTIENIVELQAQVRALESGNASFMTRFFGMDVINEELRQSKMHLKELQRMASTTKTDDFVKIIDSFIVKSEVSGTLLASQVEQLKKVRDELASGKIGKIEAERIYQGIANTATAASEAIASVSDSSSALSKAMIKNIKAFKGPSAETVAIIEGIQGAYISATRVGKEGADSYITKLMESNEALTTYIKTTGGAKTTVDHFRQGLEDLIGAYKSNDKVIQDTNSKLAKNKELVGELKNSYKNSPSQVKAYYTAVNDGQTLVLRNLNAEISNLSLASATEDKIANKKLINDKIGRKGKEREAVIAQRAFNLVMSALEQETSRLTIDKKRVSEKLKLFDLEKGMLAATTRSNKAALELAKIQSASRNASGTLNASQERGYAYKAAQAELTLAGKKLEMEKTRIDLSFALIDAEYALLEAKMREARPGKDLTSEQKALLSSARAINDYTKAIAYASLAASRAELKAQGSAAALSNRGSMLGTGGTGSSVYDSIKGTESGRVSATREAFATAKSEGGNIERGTGADSMDKFKADLAEAKSAQKIAMGKAWKNMSVGAKSALIQSHTQLIIDQIKQIGPEGELVAAMSNAAFGITAAFSNMAIAIGESSSKMETSAAVLGAVGSAMGQISAIMSAASNVAVSSITDAIEAEKKRDGKSENSVNKIKAMEAKKESIQRKAFNDNKKMQMANVAINTAAGIAQAIASAPYPLNFVLAGITGALGAAQMALIAGTSFKGGGKAPGAPSGISIGERTNKVDTAGQNAGGELSYMRGERGVGGISDFKPAFTGTRHRASGGATSGFIVGEQGPELFVPETPGTIKPADETANGTGGSTTLQFNINAIDSKSVEELLMNNSGTIIKNIRNAANQHGVTFLETVEEDSLT